jgi:hypothetical protein
MLHTTSITQRQMPALVEISERPSDDHTIFKCPLCPDERRLMLLHNHVAAHMEEISLFVLSNSGVEDERSGEKDKTDSGSIQAGAESLGSRMSLSSHSNASEASESSLRPAQGATGAQNNQDELSLDPRRSLVALTPTGGVSESDGSFPNILKHF